MIDINLIRQEPDKVAAALLKKGVKVDFTEFLTLDTKRKELIKSSETMKAERNKVSGEIPTLKKSGKDVTSLIASMKDLGDKITDVDKELDAVNERINAFILKLPNMPDDDVVAGDKDKNEVIKVFGKQPKFGFEPKNHVDLCTKLGLIDYERGVKLGGNGFWIYRGMGARLEWALLNYFIETHIKDGYEFILPPHMLGYNCGLGAGQFPKFTDEVYWIKTGDNEAEHFMLPTAETALVNMYGGEIIDESKLPMKFAGYTPCYRKEAGSYRSEERGMIRGHQFNKVEMIQYTTQEGGKAAFEEMVDKAAKLVEGLGLHFRISKLAAEDCSYSMARTYDIEVWIPSMNIYKEVSSVSNANEYQARRNNTRYRSSDGKLHFINTLNGSGLATSRVFPAIIEQYQNADGSITVPEVLRKYIGADVIK